MRITILQGPFLPVPAICGGAVEKLWFALGLEFASRGHDVTHISRRHPLLPCHDMIGNVRHHRITGFNAPPYLLLRMLFDFVYSLRALLLLPRADILITNTFWMPLLLLPFKNYFGHIVVDVERMPKGQFKFYRSVSIFRCCSRAVLNALISEAPLLRSRAHVIPNCLPFQPSPTVSWNKHGKIILYCGRLHPEKGIELLLKSFTVAAQLRDSGWILRIVGPSGISEGGGGISYLNHLKALSSDFPSSVQWVGPLYNSNDLIDEYKSASIFVYPSLAEAGEAFGLAPLEAMAYGAVPVVSSLACFRDFIIHDYNGLIFDHRLPNPINTLASCLSMLTIDPHLLTTLSERARNVTNTHHPSIIAQDMLYLFCDVLANPKF